MAQQFSGIIAQQTVPFRGTSTISIRSLVPTMPNFKAIRGAAYLVNVTGGVSGSFGVIVLGVVGGLTCIIAGNTTVSATQAAGQSSFIIYPASYGTDGLLNALETAMAAGTRQIIDIVPPTAVAFQSAVATAGISANVTVSAAIQGVD